MTIGNNTILRCPEKSVILDCVIGDNCSLHAPIWIGDNLIVGDNCRIQAFCFLPEGVELGNNVFLGPSCIFTNDRKPPASREAWEKTIVEDDVSIGAGCVIVCGVRIGKGSMIGAGTTVFKDIPPNSTVVNKKEMKFL